LKELLNAALNTAKSSGASYADMRIVEEMKETLLVKNGKVEMIELTEDFGFGVRTIVGGAWGFASSAELKREQVEKTAQLSCRVAKASRKAMEKEVSLAASRGIVDSYRTPYETDPFGVSLAKKLELLMEAEKLMRKVKGVAITEAEMLTWKTKKWFASTDGSMIDQELLGTGTQLRATAMKNGDMQVRSYPNLQGQYAAKGYELIDSLKLTDNAERVAEEAVALLSAKPCPHQQSNLILDSALTAIYIHESVGHPTELDRVLGTEANFAGTSHLTLDKRGQFQFASPEVQIVADATIPTGLGTFGWDDEGIEASNFHLVKDGMFVGYLTSRETAPVVEARSNGTMRADSWKNLPLIRMTNINLLPGKGSLDEIVANTDEGFYFEGFKTVSIDDKRLNFSLGPEIGWAIKKGKRDYMVKNPVFTGISYKVWRSCDWIGGEEDWVLWGEPYCGKGEPIQVMRVGHGAPPVRFKNVLIGAKS